MQGISPPDRRDPEGAPAARTARRESSKARVLNAALEMFRREGFESVTMDDVATAAGVSRASVFRYFGSKDDIVFEGEHDLGASLRTCVQRASSPRSAGLAFATQLEAVADALRVRYEVVRSSQVLADRAVRTRARWEELFARELARTLGRDRPVLEDRAVAITVVGAIWIALFDWLPQPRGSLRSHVRRALRVVPDVGIARRDVVD